MIAVDRPVGYPIIPPPMPVVQQHAAPIIQWLNRDVPTILSYYQPPPDGETPYQYITDPPPGVRRHNLSHNHQPAVIHDLRGNEKIPTLDSTGFQFFRHASQESSFTPEEDWKDAYYEETSQLIKDVTGAKRVFIFEHTIRRKYEGKVGINTNAPLHRVHIDQTFKAAVNRVYLHFPEDADRLLGSRYRIINVWRPIKHTVAHNPLALLDARSFKLDDLVPIKYYLPGRESGVFSLTYDPGHKWYYLSDQAPDEVAVFKCYDSVDDGMTARCCPHSAFFDSSSSKDAPQRESIEVRALVFDAE